MVDKSAPRKKNKRGDYTGIPTNNGKLYYCQKEAENTGQNIATTQFATKYYDLTNIKIDEFQIPYLDI